jgi:hypothetical protein
VRRVLKKQSQAVAQKSRGASGRSAAEFVAAMEEVLALSAAPFDAKRRGVNFDETSKQLI